MKLLVLVVLLCLWDFATCDCMLCEDGVLGLKRPGFQVDSSGTVCAKKMHDVYLLGSETLDCTIQIQDYREMCCGEEDPTPVPRAPTRPPASSIHYVGPNPMCNICWNRVFPGTPAMVINMLNVGMGSCRQFFRVGLEGRIVPNMCETLQVSCRPSTVNELQCYTLNHRFHSLLS